MKKSFVILLFLSLICLGSEMQLGTSGMKLGNFQTNGVSQVKNQQGKLEPVTWVVKGVGAQVNMPEYHIREFEMTLDSPERGKYLIRSPKCTFNQNTSELHSNSPVEVTGPDLQFSGIGYDLYWTKDSQSLTLVVRSAVRIVVTRNAIKDSRK